jgi:truncated hemoglobin YjbI
VAPKFEQASQEEPEVTGTGEKVYQSFYQQVLRRKREAPVFEKEVDLDDELRKLENLKLNRQQ